MKKKSLTSFEEQGHSTSALETNLDNRVVSEVNGKDVVTADVFALQSAEDLEPNAILDSEDASLESQARTLSPIRLVLKRFFRSKLSVIGLTLIVLLFLFSFLGPVIFQRWGEIATDYSGKWVYSYTLVNFVTPTGETVQIYQLVKEFKSINSLAPISPLHWLGTDNSGMDVFTRIMYGGRISLMISIIVVLLETILGVVLGGLAGYFGKWVDQLIMRIVDIFNSLPTFPILLIIGSLLEAAHVDPGNRIYFLMMFLTLFSWSGIARIVRGQILSLREQEYMVAAEAMGLSTGRKIFKHLVPNIMPQLIVSMTLGLGSTILYEASLSYLGMGVKAPYAAWGTMINIITEDTSVFYNNFNVWGPPGICIILAVLAFNFIGDGLRDALDPKMKR